MKAHNQNREVLGGIDDEMASSIRPDFLTDPSGPDDPQSALIPNTAKRDTTRHNNVCLINNCHLTIPLIFFPRMYSLLVFLANMPPT